MSSQPTSRSDDGPSPAADRSRGDGDPEVAPVAVPDVEIPAFPAIGALDAIAAWLDEPSEERRADVAAALLRVVRTAGARGIRLVVGAAPLPALVIEEGTLADAWTAEREAATSAYELSAAEAPVTLGRLWLDGGGSRTMEAVRALELTLDAGWSRAEIGQTVDRLSALDAATRAIAGVLSLDRVLQLIVDLVRDLAGARYAALGFLDEHGVIEEFVASGMDRETRERIGPLPQGRGLLGALVREEHSIRIPDIAADPRSVGFPPGHPTMRSFLGVPVRVKAGGAGNLYLTDKRGGGEFTEADQELVEMFSVHAGIAIENARLHERIQRLAIVEERERIGRDLHDGIIQRLYAVGLSLEDVPELMEESPPEASARVDRAIESINLTIRDIRNFIFGLRPELLEQADLVASLAALADEFRMNTLVDIDLAVDPEVVLDLPAEDRSQLLQIAREGLSNIARHARATQAEVAISSRDGAVVLSVSDNGCGFDPSAVHGPSHQGLANMEGRADILGGTLDIESEPGAGTRIIVRVPPRDRAAGAMT